MNLLSGLVLEDGRAWAEAACDFQVADAEAVLDPDAGLRWHYITRARGGAKTGDLAGVVISWLLTQAPVAARGYGVAADADQAGKVLEAVEGFLLRTPDMAGALLIQARKIRNPKTGAEFEVLPADAPGAYGHKPHLLVVDEFAQWPTTPAARKLWTAMFSAMSKVPGARLVIITSAGDPAHFAFDVLQRARQRTKRWRVSELDGRIPWVSEEEIAEQSAMLLPSEVQQLHFNQWAATEDRAMPNVRECATLDGWPRDPVGGFWYVVGVDLSRTRDNTVVAVCHGEPLIREHLEPTGLVRQREVGQRVVLDRMRVWTPSTLRPIDQGEVLEYVSEVAFQYQSTVVFDPYDASGMMQELQARGVHVVAYNMQSVAAVDKLASTLFHLTRDRRLALPSSAAHPDAEALLEELEHIRLRKTSLGTLRIDHDSNRHDDRGMAIGLAAQHITYAPYVPPPPPITITSGGGRWNALRRDGRGGGDSDRIRGLRAQLDAYGVPCPLKQVGQVGQWWETAGR
jgi:hypothetical protein